MSRSLVPLQLIFTASCNPDPRKNQEPVTAWEHVGFYDLFGGIPEVVTSSREGQTHKTELRISPLNKYAWVERDIVTLWLTDAQKVQIGKAVQAAIAENDATANMFVAGVILQARELSSSTLCACQRGDGAASVHRCQAAGRCVA